MVPAEIVQRKGTNMAKLIRRVLTGECFIFSLEEEEEEEERKELKVIIEWKS